MKIRIFVIVTCIIIAVLGIVDGQERKTVPVEEYQKKLELIAHQSEKIMILEKAMEEQNGFNRELNAILIDIIGNQDGTIAPVKTMEELDRALDRHGLKRRIKDEQE